MGEREKVVNMDDWRKKRKRAKNYYGIDERLERVRNLDDRKKRVVAFMLVCLMLFVMAFLVRGILPYSLGYWIINGSVLGIAIGALTLTKESGSIVDRKEGVGERKK